VPWPGRWLRWTVTARGRSLLGLVLAWSASVPVPAVALDGVAELLARADALVEADDASPPALQQAVALYQEAARREPGAPLVAIGLAEAALQLGDVAGREALRWYEVAQAAAERAVALDGARAHAHFLLAATRGQVARQRPIYQVSPRIVGELEEHLRRALARDPGHARALHMMGMLLQDTPWILRLYLTGSQSEVGRYLTAAVAANPLYPHARLDLAEHHRRAGRLDEARAQARAVLALPLGRSRRWRETYRPQAEALLQRLGPE
jgi:hypothetical protein